MGATIVGVAVVTLYGDAGAGPVENAGGLLLPTTPAPATPPSGSTPPGPWTADLVTPASPEGPSAGSTFPQQGPSPIGPSLQPPTGPTGPPVGPPVGPPSARSKVRIPSTGPGTFRVAGAAPAVVPTAGETTYTVEVERTVPFSPRTVAKSVRSVLRDRRGWSRVLGVDLVQVATGSEPDLRVLLATPKTTDALCAPLRTLGRVSCRNGDLVVLNALRWTRAVPDYRGRVGAYRTYLINHEVGHALGRSHEFCPGPGMPAPVMMQQTYGLGACKRNVWPSVSP